MQVVLNRSDIPSQAVVAKNRILPGSRLLNEQFTPKFILFKKFGPKLKFLVSLSLEFDFTCSSAHEKVQSTAKALLRPVPARRALQVMC